MKSDYRIHLKMDTCVWMLYALCISIPWHTTANVFYSWIHIVGNITYLHLFASFLMVISILSTLKKGIKIHKRKLIIGVLIILLIRAMLIGTAPINSKLMDSSLLFFLQIPLFYCICSKLVNKVDLFWFLKFTTRCMNINVTINIIMYITRNLAFWKISNSDESRFGGGYFTLLIITGGFAFLSICYNDKKLLEMKEAIYTLVCSCFAFIVSATRTNILLFILLLLFIYFVSLFGKMSAKKFFLMILIFLTVILAICFVINSNIYLIERIFNNKTILQDGNMKIRISTFVYYFDKIVENPWGFGFGYLLHFVHPNGFALDNQLSVDNTFIYFSMKCGIALFIIYIIIIAIEPIKFIIKNKIEKKIQWSIIAIFIVYLFAVSVMTNQVVFGYATSSFVWAFAGVVYRNNCGE